MKAENILKLAERLKTALDPNNEHPRPASLDKLKALDAMIPNDPVTLASLLVAECVEDIRQSEIKKTGRTTAYKAALRILKSAESGQPTHKDWAYAQIIEGFQYFTNGYALLRLANKLPLEPVPADVGITMQLDAKFMEYIAPCTVEIKDLPTAGEVAAYIKKARAASSEKNPRIDYRFACGLFVNAEYLRDVLEIIDDEGYTAYANAENTRLYIKSEFGADALVFGLRRDRTPGITPAQ